MTNCPRCGARLVLKQGREWHGWAFKGDHTWRDDGTDGFFFWAEANRPKDKPSPDGKWVKVRFVEVKRSARKRKP